MRLVAYLFPLIVAGCGAPSGPRVELLDTEINLGKIKTEVSHRTKIRIRNAGTEPLQIKDVEVGCGCTRPTFPKTIAPGKEAVIDIDFTPELLWNGARTEPITIHTNDPSNAKVVAKLVSDLDPPVHLDTKSPHVLKFAPGQEATFLLKATAREGIKPPVVGATSNDPRVQVGLSSAGSASLVRMSYGKKRVGGDIDAHIRLKLDNVSVPWVEFHLKGEANDAPFVVPALVQARQLKASASGTRLSTLAVHGRGSAAPKILSARSEDSALDFKIEKDEAKNRTWISVIYKGGWQPGARSATIILATDNKNFPTIEVPVVANVVGS